LPEAEYNYEGSIARGSVMTKAKTAADNTDKIYSILITESNGRTWHNLDKV